MQAAQQWPPQRHRDLNITTTTSEFTQIPYRLGLYTGTAEYYVDPTTDGYPDDNLPLPPAITGHTARAQAT